MWTKVAAFPHALSIFENGQIYEGILKQNNEIFIS